jgi:HlyD family secretion protein
MTRNDADDNRGPEAAGAESETSAEIAGLPPAPRPPAVLPTDRGPPLRRRAQARLVRAGSRPTPAAVGYWWFSSQPALPAGIVSGNGRREADEIDIDTKFAGRIAKMFVDEGDLVRQGQVVAMMDTQDLAATLKKDEALVDEAQRALDEAKANLAQQQTQVTFARQELDRAPAGAERVRDRRTTRSAASADGSGDGGARCRRAEGARGRGCARRRHA